MMYLLKNAVCFRFSIIAMSIVALIVMLFLDHHLFQFNILLVSFTKLSKYGSQFYVDIYSKIQIEIQEDAACH